MDTIQLEWLNQNSLRAYPIREDCSRIPCDSQGNVLSSSIALPNYVITDFVMAIDPSKSADIYVGTVAYFGTFLNIVISAAHDNTTENIGYVSIDLNGYEPNSPHRFVCTGSYSASVGTLVTGDLSRLPDDLPQGRYTYTVSQTAFEATCIRPSIHGVMGISVVDGITGHTSTPLRGDVKLISGSNIEFDYDQGTNTITINAGDGLGFSEECDCGGQETKTITSINGITARNVKLFGDGCISITENTQTGIIKITDTCAKPCCGCAELAFINDKISEIQTAIGRLSNYASELVTAQSALHSMQALDRALK